jgi:hypothetical protein
VGHQAVDRLAHLHRIQWLEQIIYCLQPESVGGAVSISGGENQARRLWKHG